jgi:hypothetical protein
MATVVPFNYFLLRLACLGVLTNFVYKTAALIKMEDCQHILNALGAFDYVAATKLISKLTKVKLIFYSSFVSIMLIPL